MRKITFLQAFAGSTFSHRPGQTVPFPEGEAAKLIAAGVARPSTEGVDVEALQTEHSRAVALLQEGQRVLKEALRDEVADKDKALDALKTVQAENAQLKQDLAAANAVNAHLIGQLHEAGGKSDVETARQPTPETASIPSGPPAPPPKSPLRVEVVNTPQTAAERRAARNSGK